MPTSEVIRKRLFNRARLRHWEGFARVAELGSVRKAADVIGLAQPALSQLLQDLENLLGAPLFERHARGMHLTTMGREMLPSARALIRNVDRLAEQAAALQSRAQGVVRIGAIGGAVTGLLTIALPVLAEQRPDLLVEVQEIDAGGLDALIARGEIDVALCRQPNRLQEGWSFEPLLADRYVVVAGAKHPRIGHSISIEELHGETWLSMPAGSAARVTFDRLFGEFEPHPAMCQISGRVPNILWAMLKSKPLLAMVPASLVHQLLEVGELVEIKLLQTLPLDSLGALYQLADSPSSVEVLLQVLRESALQQ
jgi:DNA-binding transcriptional LysR family regulator